MTTGAQTSLGQVHRLYLDESGDHTFSIHDNVGKRYLGLVGVMFSWTNYEAFQMEFEAFKRTHFNFDPDDPIVLHRKELIYRNGPFKVLLDPAKRDAFDRDLLTVVARAQFTSFAVVIDKASHAAKGYRGLRHCYHYCVHAMMERYCGLMRFRPGWRGDVMAESRGHAEDVALAAEFREVATSGTTQMREGDLATLTSKDVKIRRKSDNVAGLQLADILAHPLTRDVLRVSRGIEGCGGSFNEEIVKVATPKYNRRALTGQIDGYGRKLLD
jgi:hypothetical protein